MHNFSLLYLTNACGARGKRPLCVHLHRTRYQFAEVTTVFIASVQKLFPVENSSSKSLSQISVFEGQKPDAGLTRHAVVLFSLFVPLLPKL